MCPTYFILRPFVFHSAPYPISFLAQPYFILHPTLFNSVPNLTLFHSVPNQTLFHYAPNPISIFAQPYIILFPTLAHSTPNSFILCQLIDSTGKLAGFALPLRMTTGRRDGRSRVAVGEPQSGSIRCACRGGLMRNREGIALSRCLVPNVTQSTSSSTLN